MKNPVIAKPDYKYISLIIDYYKQINFIIYKCIISFDYESKNLKIII